MKRRLGGCFLLLLLAVPPFLGICHALVLFSHSRNVVERLVLCLVYLVMFLGGTHFLAREAQHSRVGMLLRADVVPVDDVASYIDQCSANVALKINFNVSTALAGHGFSARRRLLCVNVRHTSQTSPTPTKGCPNQIPDTFLFLDV